jgi:hypothetical protein
MKTPSFHDAEILSAWLDGELPQGKKARLEARLKSDSALASLLEDLRQIRSLLRRAPKRRAPRKFTLSPGMNGVHPPLPRVVPVLSWASAAAMLLFVLALGTNLLGQLAAQSAMPMLAAAPMSAENYDNNTVGGAQAPETTSSLATPTAEPLPTRMKGGGYGGGPPAGTEAPSVDTSQASPTEEVFSMMAAEATPESGARQIAPPENTAANLAAEMPTIWIYLWAGLALALIIAAWMVREASLRAFRRKAGNKGKS